MDDYLRLMIDSYEMIQKERIQFGNRLDAIFREANISSEEETNFLLEQNEMLSLREKEIEKKINQHCKEIKIIKEFANVKGVGLLSAAKLIVHIDIHRCEHVSSLWKYCGYGIDPTNGEIDRPTKGEKLCYNKRAKVSAYLIATGMIRASSPYRRIYDTAKEFYQNTKPDWTKAHIHNASMRKMTKVYLSHVYHVWRRLEGYEVEMPYIIEKLGHKHYLSPAEFGWL